MNGTGSLRSHPSPAASASCVTIDEGVPMPMASTRKPYNESKYPWRKMAVGDSFLFPITRDVRYAYNSAQRAVVYRKQAQGESFKVRIVEESGERVVRVWRVA